jgi:hypothetical protein
LVNIVIIRGKPQPLLVLQQIFKSRQCSRNYSGVFAMTGGVLVAESCENQLQQLQGTQSAAAQ